MNEQFPTPSASPQPSTPVSTAKPAAAAILPRSMVFVAVVVILFIGLLVLEVSDSFFRHGGAIARSLFVLPLPVALLWGLLTRCRWAWWVTRTITVLAALLYTLPTVGVWFLYPHLQFGLRLWITAVGAILCTLVLSVYLALGRLPARAYFFESPKTKH